jgi:hypothetical protein
MFVVVWERKSRPDDTIQVLSAHDYGAAAVVERRQQRVAR